jgi:Domain of unknown function (DUF4386)
MISPLRNARIIGGLYALIIVLGLASEVGVRGPVIVQGDAAATASNILASEGLLRFAFFADSIVFLSDAAVAVLLYLLLRPVDNTIALVAAAFRLTQTAVLALNLLNQHAGLLVLTGAGYGALDPAQRDALAYLMLERHGYGYDLGLLFFGGHCLLLGYLIAKSTFLPKLLGVLLIGASFAYLLGSYVRFLAPAFVAAVAPIYIVAIAAEVGLCVWLLVKGVDAERWRAVEASTRRV